MKWSENAWKTIQPIYTRTIQMPFIQELISGTLDRRIFEFYIQQDALYLAVYGKVLTGIANKMEKAEYSEMFRQFAEGAIEVENELHRTFLQGIGVQKEASPSCLFYTSYLKGHLSSPVEVTTAAVLPCFWIYKEVGDYILEHQIKNNNPYQEWIDTYGGADFALATQMAIDITDELAANCSPKQQEDMLEAFVICSKLEYMFWNSAYNMEKWIV